MAGMQFEYDEEGGTFYYFLFSFWGLVLIPTTYYFWPRKDARDAALRNECHCTPCLNKNERLEAKEPWKKTKLTVIKILFFIGWIIFICLAYKVSRIQLEYEEYDPYLELGVDRGATQSEIRRAYRKLSLVYHPDKETGDSKKFMRIAKAYAALTDEESRKNWEEFGNPDGPEATKFGIALPKWIVERENSIWVLGLYGLIFMIMLPTCVGIWWYRSIKYSGDEVLLDTTQLYYYFFHKTPNMILKRVIMILSASFEFEKFHNADIIERESDNVELPAVMRYLNNLSETNKERPLCFPYSVKARILLHAHIIRHVLPANTLAIDQRYILEKCPVLINEMTNCVAQLVAGAAAGKFQHMPRLETIENCMKLSQMVVQALGDKASPLLQLPHIVPDMLKHFNTKNRAIRSIREFAVMNPDERRSLLRSLSEPEYADVMRVLSNMPMIDRAIRSIREFAVMNPDERRSLLRSLSEPEYADVMRVLSNMPVIDMTIRSEVLDDEDPHVTAGSIVTVTVILERRSMSELMTADSCNGLRDVGQGDVVESVQEEVVEEKEVSKKATPKVWQKQKKGKRKAAGSFATSKPKPVHHKPAQKNTDKNTDKNTTEDGDETKKQKSPTSDRKSHSAKKTTKNVTDDSNNDDHSSSDEDGGNKGKDASFEEDDWSQYQEESRKENSLETKAKGSHIVHCPHYPGEKHEYWWVYVADRKKSQLITAPVQVCSLKHEEEVKLKFSAPMKTGAHGFSVILRSDSYLDYDQTKQFKIDVHEAKIISSHPQWDMSDDDAKEGSDNDDSDNGYSSSEDESD